MGVENQSMVCFIAVLLLICTGLASLEWQEPWQTCLDDCAKDYMLCAKKCATDFPKGGSKRKKCVEICGKALTKCKNTCANNTYSA